MITEPRHRSRRSDADYAIDALAKGLRVLEALEGTGFEPVSLSRIAQRTAFTENYCLRALRTLRLAGYAEQVGAEWRLTPRFLVFCRRAVIAADHR